MVVKVEPYSSSIETFEKGCKAYINDPENKIQHLAKPLEKWVKRIKRENLSNDQEFNTQTRRLYPWLKYARQGDVRRKGSVSSEDGAKGGKGAEYTKAEDRAKAEDTPEVGDAASKRDDAEIPNEVCNFVHEVDKILGSVWEEIERFYARWQKEPYISSLDKFINKCKVYVADPDNKLTDDDADIEDRFDKTKTSFLEEKYYLRNGEEFTARAKMFVLRIQTVIDGKDSDTKGGSEEEDSIKENKEEVTKSNTKERATEGLMEEKGDIEPFEKKSGKAKLFAEESDALLKEVQTEIRSKQKENLKLSSRLMRYLGHELQRYRGVCGYSLSGVYMKFEVKMLGDVGNHNMEQVAKVIQNKISEHQNEFKDKILSDLVQFVIIRKLPKLVADADWGPQLDLQHNAQPKTQTPGVFFKNPEDKENVLLSTCTHGDDMGKYTYEVCMGHNRPSFTGEYRWHIYNEPTKCPENQQQQEEDGETAMLTVQQQQPENENIDDNQVTNNLGGAEGKQPKRSDDRTNTNLVFQRENMSNFVKERLSVKIEKVAENNLPPQSSQEASINIDVSQPNNYNMPLETGACASGTASYHDNQMAVQSYSSSTKSTSNLSLGKNQGRITSQPNTSGESQTQGGSDRNIGTEAGIDLVNDKPIHYDLCMLAVPFDKAKDFTGHGSSSTHSSDYFKIESMRMVGEDDLDEEVQKIGCKTGKTKGKLINIGGKLKCSMGDKIVWLYDVLMVEQDHKFPINYITANSDLPIVLPNAEPEVSPHANVEVYPANSFVKTGDSGAIITRDNVALGNHLYHCNTNDNVYNEVLNYSVSCHLQKAVDDICEKHKKIEFMPTTIFMPPPESSE